MYNSFIQFNFKFFTISMSTLEKVQEKLEWVFGKRLSNRKTGHFFQSVLLLYYTVVSHAFTEKLPGYNGKKTLIIAGQND